MEHTVATVIPIATINQSPLKLNRLLQLCSANLPVGGFSFSQGLEYAVEMDWVNNPESTKEWVSFNLNQSIARTDLALLKRLQKALVEDDFASFYKWNQHALACRESNELYLADVAMGKALMRLLKDIKGIDSQHYVDLISEKEISFVSAFALILDFIEFVSGALTDFGNSAGSVAGDIGGGIVGTATDIGSSIGNFFGFATGSANIENDQIAQIHQGERIVPKTFNESSL